MDPVGRVLIASSIFKCIFCFGVWMNSNIFATVEKLL